MGCLNLQRIKLEHRRCNGIERHTAAGAGRGPGVSLSGVSPGERWTSQAGLGCSAVSVSGRSG